MQVFSADGSSEIGMITKQWTGCTRETFTDAANFGIQCNEFLISVMQLLISVTHISAAAVSVIF